MTSRTTLDRWLKCLGPKPDARLRLVIIPYAGGAAGPFCSWATAMPPEIEVWAFQLPGRENRLGEPAARCLDDLIPAMVDAVGRLDCKPYVLFGHSMGALLGYELYHQLRDRGVDLPRRLILSGCASPALRFERQWPHGDDENVLRSFRSLGGIPEDVNLELLRLMLPTLRADIEVCATYAYQPRAAIDRPVTALAGQADLVATPGRVAAWRDLVSCDFAAVTRPGGHMFVLAPEFPTFLATLLPPQP